MTCGIQRDESSHVQSTGQYTKSSFSDDVSNVFLGKIVE